jgi:NADH-quinone oxidoreductase subunit C
MINEITSLLKSKFPDSLLNVASEDKRITLLVKKEELHQILSQLKDAGFNHLSDVTAVDYIDEQEFELIYHLWSHQEKIRAIVKVRIPREVPTVKSVVNLWTGAQIHEREDHELFGINFEGNPNLSPLFLEDWEEIPPFRKDFDTRKYVKEKYYQEDEQYPIVKG